MSWQLRRNIANIQCLSLTLRHALKQSCHWSIAWSMKLCWLLTTFQSDAASARWRTCWFLINMFLRVGLSRCLQALQCTGLVFMQPGVKVNGAYYCDVLLQKQLLPDICQAARDLLSSASRVRKSTELLRNKTPDFTQDVASPQTRPQFCRLQITQVCDYQKQQGVSNIVDELWLLTEWHYHIILQIYFTR